MRSMKKITAFLLAMVMVLSLIPSAFAADDDYFDVTFDNQEPAADDEITATVTLKKQFGMNTVKSLSWSFRYNSDYMTCTNVNLNGQTFKYSLNEKKSGEYASNISFSEYSDTSRWCSVPKGFKFEFTFEVTDDAAGQALNTSLDCYTYGKKFKLLSSEENFYNLTVADSTGEPRPTATGYTVSMAADQQVAAGNTVSIPVTVASSKKKITGFNAYDMTFTYDPAALTLNTTSDDAANLTVEDNNGSVRVRRYGATQALGEALALDFTAKATATSTVKLTNAKFDLDANSINFDAPEATISDADTVVNANNFTVTLPDAFTSDETRLVPKGGSFTFKPVDSHYTYTFTVKMGDTVTEGLTFGANDTYTIEKISGNVEVTCTGKTPKQYDVKYKIDEDVEQDVTKGPETVTYLNDYSFVVTPRAGYSYRVIYSVDNGDPFVHTVIAVPTANDDGTLTYTIPGKEIVGGVEIWIDANTESGIPVVFTGNGVEDAASGNASSMGKNMPYYFTLNQRESCDYTVTAYYQPLASSTASKRPATVRSLGNGKYVVEAVNYNDYLYVYAHSWNLVVKVEKVSHSAEEVTVSKYLELNDKTMMLVTVKGTPEGGSAFTYDGNTMYKVEGYGTDRYAWLVIVDKGQTLTQEKAAAKVAISAADNVVTITPSFDVNRTGKVDVNDAQLVYDMYNGTYSNFTQVSVEKFLRADVNATKVVDHTDAVAIVNQFK